MYIRSPWAVSLWVASRLLGLAAADNPKKPVESAELFDWEKAQLTEDLLQEFKSDVRPLFAFYHETTQKPEVECKVFPGDPDWPEESVWDTFSQVIDGKLLHPLPEASVCYEGPAFDSDACDMKSANWSNSYERMKDPLEVFWPSEVGLTCLPPSVVDTGGCTQGGYPVYVVNATNVALIQLAVNFARNTGVRLVIKNTGHDFLGKSSGAGALSIWTHNLKDLAFYDDYSAPGYSGPAFKAAAGVQLFEIYKAASDKGLMIVGGEGQTIGAFGGYTQGGGHSPLTNLHGLAADQVLAIEVVTPDGHFVSANAKENSDLFWAIRGGGGSTFGVVTSMVIKAFPDIKATTSTFTIDAGAMDLENDTFWAAFDAVFAQFPRFTKAGAYLYVHSFPGSTLNLNIGPFFAPGKSVAEVEDLVAPLLSELKDIGVELQPNWTEYSGFHQAWKASFPLEMVEMVRFASSSRLWPRGNWDDEGPKFRAMMDAIRYAVERGYVLNGFNLSPTFEVAAAKPGDAAVNPAWRDTYCHLIAGVAWGEDLTVEEQIDLRHDFTNVHMKRWRDASPGAGSYMSEADRLEPDFQQSFFGSNYDRLLGIKKKYDPEHVLWAVTAVGSDDWAVRSVDGLPDENGKLCRVKKADKA